MKNMIITFPLLIFLLFSGCKKNSKQPLVPSPIINCLDTIQYYSDYYVFISDDDKSPLVIPADINWRPIGKEYNSEFKGWYGTENEWPIAYFNKDTLRESCQIPKESWNHFNGEYFSFNKTKREIILTIWNAPVLRLMIPEEAKWITMPAPLGANKEIKASKTDAWVDNELRTGWIIYERIRRSGKTFVDTKFTRFHWIPFIVDNNLYHFQIHGKEKTGTRWINNNNTIIVDTTTNYTFNIDSVSSDLESGRNNIPQKISIIANQWNINIETNSTGNQTGYGPMFHSGLAYYRQSLLQSTSNSSNSGYGMLELILED